MFSSVTTSVVSSLKLSQHQFLLQAVQKSQPLFELHIDEKCCQEPAENNNCTHAFHYKTYMIFPHSSLMDLLKLSFSLIDSVLC